MSEDGGVAAVDRALSILDALTDEKVSLAEISKRTGLYKSTVLRLLKSLEKFGYVLRSEEGSYRLGSKAFYLGSLYQRHFRTSEVVPPVLKRVVEELHEGASFYVQEGDKRVCLHRVDAARAVRDSVHEGDTLLLTVGAAGHVLRAFAGVRGDRYNDIRQKMYASSVGERDSETAAIAAPVFGVDQKLIGALSVSGPRYRIEALGTERIVPVLFRHARELTRTFGGDAGADAFLGWREAPSEPERDRPRPAGRDVTPARKAPARSR